MIEYYECFHTTDTNCFTFGKIYKCLNSQNLEDVGNFIDDKGDRNGWGGSNYKHFKPSTLEAFNIQECIIFKRKKTKKENLSYLIKFLNKLNIK